MTSALQGSAAQGRFVLAILTRAVRDLEDAHRALEPLPGLKTAGWHVGHLAVTGDFGRKLCGQPPLCPREWRSAFNPGSQPSPNADDYPPMALLIDTVLAVYDDLCATAPRADPSLLALKNPFVPGQESFPTAGDFVAYLLTGHFAYHVGQLKLWRAAVGLTEAT